ncbi:MAG: hypothetical protein A2066_14125 [Bacteroidetes bacterium GWB2_41_8]|nr:MAG: hypothetical protein A2066_14125 [Bacteroidetes bacterium GWB2_41_8]
MKNNIENKAEDRRKNKLISKLPLFPSPFSVLLFLFLSSVLFTSCEDVIDVKLNDENLNLFGVEASITTQDEPGVFLYKTLQVNQDTEYPGISGAVVSVSDNASPANSVTLVEDEQKKGFYSVPQNVSFKGIAGREYTLTIQAEGTTITAKEQLARVEPIDSIRVFPSMRGNKLFLAVFTYGKETPGIGNFYKWDVFVNDSLLTNGQRLAVASDEFVDGNYISGLEVYTDFHNTDKAAEERKINLGDTIYVKHTSISKFTYYFYFQMINQSGTGSLFSVPPANIKSNFTSSDGKPVLGLFTARDVSVSNKVIVDQKIEDQLRKLK